LAITSKDTVPQQPLPEEEGPTKAERVVADLLKKWYVIAAPIGVIVLIVVILGISESHSRAVANRAFQAAMKAEGADDYLAIHNKYPRTTTGRMALKQAADSLYSDGEYSRSRELYQQYLDSYPDDQLNAWIQNQIGFTFEAEGDYDKALEAYEKVFSYDNYIYLEEQLDFNRGRCYEMKGDIETAKSYYNNLISKAGTSGSGWANEARSRLERLEPST